MLQEQTLKALDCAGEVRNKLESLKVVLDLFCHAYLDGSEEAVILSAKVHAHEMQYASDALFTLLFDAQDVAVKAENAAEEAHSKAMSQVPAMKKDDVLHAIYSTFSLEDKRQLGEQLLRMTAS